jgi:hypothetical protein
MRKELPVFETATASSLDERKTWLLPGDNYLVVMGAGLFAVLCFVIATSLGESILMRFLAFLFPLGGAGLYLGVAVIGKPPRYAADWWAKLGKSKDFGLNPQVLLKRVRPHFLFLDVERAS